MALGSEKEQLIFVPDDYRPEIPAHLAIMLHGAGGNAAQGLHLLQNFANEHNIIVAAPASKDYSWDIIAANTFGSDVLLIDQVLEYVFARFTINPGTIAIGGFSDGASYALCIGLGNGNLFTHILAFSPGFYHVVEARGKPEVFISHGTHDRVLPINACSRRIVPKLQDSKVPVIYREFEGEHVIPGQIAAEAVLWFTGKETPGKG